MDKRARNIFENLKGDWTLNRIIKDLNLNEINTASGVASFSQSSLDEIDSLYYVENGKLLLKKINKLINFTREYIYKIVDNQIDIILNDGVTKGNLFQTLIFENNEHELKGSEHICKLDRHNGKYYFIDKFNFYIEYTVNGPKTNLLIRTNYSKINNACL
ncbi:DUF6314 family protein [Hugenholtzia roseola]|uniref:DUF6314 family protein n=1 Tax=Hugenholtzia roseola TaxID=1002 RepID=UPI0004790DAA|nr:DUF6314 family protein [Hugenholtzia roseola]